MLHGQENLCFAKNSRIMGEEKMTRRILSYILPLSKANAGRNGEQIMYYVSTDDYKFSV